MLLDQGVRRCWQGERATDLSMGLQSRVKHERLPRVPLCDYQGENSVRWVPLIVLGGVWLMEWHLHLGVWQIKAGS
jgi:hypothetical protein